MTTLARILGEIASDLDDTLGVVEEGLRSLRELCRANDLHFGVLERSLEAVHRGYRLSGELRDVGRGAPLRFRPTDVNPLVLEVAERIRRNLPDEVQTKVRMNGRIRKAHSDQVALRSALLALGGGLADAMPRCGSLTWETRIDRVEEPASRRLTLSPGRHVTIEILARAEPGEPPLDISHLGWSRRSGPLRSSGLGGELEGSLEVSTSKSGEVAVRLYLPPSLGDESP